MDHEMAHTKAFKKLTAALSLVPELTRFNDDRQEDPTGYWCEASQAYDMIVALREELAELKAQKPVGWLHEHEDYTTEFSKLQLRPGDFRAGFTERAVFVRPVAATELKPIGYFSGKVKFNSGGADILVVTVEGENGDQILYAPAPEIS